MSSSVLVTGATGFVGYHVAAALLQQGRDVHIVVRPTSSTERLRRLSIPPVVHEHDGTTRGLMRIVERAAPRTVFHLAALVSPLHTPDDVAPLIQSNLLFGSQLLEASVQSGVSRFINTGTFWQHYQGDDYEAVCLYAATKQAFEDILQFYTDVYPLRAATLKLFDTYGPDDPRGKIFTLFQRSAASGALIPMSPGEQKLDLVYIDDVVQAFLQVDELLDPDHPPPAVPTYAVSSGEQLSLRQVVAIYERVTGNRLNIQWGGRPYRDREVMTPWRGPTVPGWKPAFDLASGIKQMEMVERGNAGNS